MRVEPAGGEHPVAGGDVQVAGARVLRQVAHLAAAGDGAGRGLGDPGEGLGQRGLARAVAPDQAHPVARGHPERRGVEEQAGARAQLDGGSGDHGGAFRWWGGRARQGLRSEGTATGFRRSSLGAAALRAVHAPAPRRPAHELQRQRHPRHLTGRAPAAGGGGAPGGMVVGGGIGGIIILILTLLFNGVFGGGGDPTGGPAASTPARSAAAGGPGRRGVPAVQDRRRRQQVHRVPRHRHGELRAGLLGAASCPATARSGSRRQDGALRRRHPVGCGTASNQVGPFYCPLDKQVYIDASFFQILQQQFGSSGGPLAQEYVVAHEYGHPSRTMLGLLDRAQQDPQGPSPGPCAPS